MRIWRFDIIAEQLQDGEASGASALTFLYKLVIGFGQISYACEVAALAGIHPDILSRAREIEHGLRTSHTVPHKPLNPNLYGVSWHLLALSPLFARAHECISDQCPSYRKTS